MTRAVLIAASTGGASAARVATARDTVGSEATAPNTPGSPRRTAMSARQSPPSASVTARSLTILAGSWAANGLRHGPSAPDRARSRPTARTVSVNAAAPAWDTTPDPPASTRTRG
jgi:hypothetical protein